MVNNTEYYLGTEQELLDIDSVISINSGMPFKGTFRWGIPTLTINTGVYALIVPQGAWGLTKEQMTKGVNHLISTGVAFPKPQV